ncbi:MAG: glycerol kinase [Demequinaceae bacterium]|nr:glycerol kinase [Demequinaceae bacterium]
MADRMPADALVVAIDQGTSSTKAIVVDASGKVVGQASVPLGQTHPEPGWVEQDPLELLSSVKSAIQKVASKVSGTIVAMGISSQRESALAWDSQTLEPLGPMLGWQDRRTKGEAQRLQAEGHEARVRAITGLPIDPMFSALKFAWLLDSIDPDRSRAEAGKIALGTVDSWIVHSLTGEHRIETGNASRTQVLNLDSGDWEDSLLELFRIPRQALPRIASSQEHTAPIKDVEGVPSGVPISGVLADSHAALYGHGVREPGAVKVTYGTGSSIMGLLAPGAHPGEGLVRTIAWDFGKPVQAFEGNILSTGATVVWLAQLLSKTPSELGALAEQAGDSHGVFLVPAFAGLGAPWWDDEALGIMAGLTLGSSEADLACAAFESIAFQIEDVLVAADAGSGRRIHTILADGGPSSNSWLMQLQANLSQRDVVASSVADLSALGVAYLAGSSVGLWSDSDAATFSDSAGTTHPGLDTDTATERRAAWLGAVARARGASLAASQPEQAADRGGQT